ncbi:unnamed protein product [Somion occarium]|uniref:Uncharacterized protein n=1 Tax=Somion occarium TaxID=3059160 RepID=A0ABP1DX04_9APHY
MRVCSTVVALLTAVATVSAKNVFIQVGGNTTDNATAVFNPAQVFAKLNDIVVFNFTEGNHTATQSTFSSPCIPASLTDSTINGFNSGFRDTVNGTAITIQSVPITPDLVNTTIWFFDFHTCAQGGVGGININDSSTETLDGFVRNAIRLNGTDSQDTNSSTSTNTSSSTTSSGAPNPSTSASGNTSDAIEQRVVFGALSVIPLVLAAFVL